MMRQIRILLLVLNVLLLLSVNALAGVPVNMDERYTFLGEADDFYYFGWANTNEQSANKHLWIKIMQGDAGRELLNEQGGFPSGSVIENQEIDSILCRIDVKNDVKAIQVAEQIYYGQSGIVIAQWTSSEWNGQSEKTAVHFIADECVGFLTAYFNLK